MSARDVVRIAGAFGVSALVAWALLSVPTGIPSAASAPCPDSEVVFARGSGQPVGLGDVGQAFVDAIRSQVPGRSIADYPVDYPASHDYRNSALVGAGDASAHIESVVANCPDTKLVLGGYSQGASVIELATDSLPASVADHVAAVALFGTPSSGYASAMMGDPLPTLAAPYRPKSIDLCLPDDIVCDQSGSMLAHIMYTQSGMVDEAATFAASRL